MRIFWYVCNIGIAAGYYILALSLYKLLAQFMIVNWKIKAGAIFFFAMCSLTHLEHAYHLYAQSSEPVADVFLATHSLVIHGVQVVAVWLFLWGVLQALSLSRGLDRRTAEHLHGVMTDRAADRRHPPADRRS